MGRGRKSEEKQIRKSVYFTEEQLKELTKESKRLDRSVSWIMQRVWKIARKKIRMEQ